MTTRGVVVRLTIIRLATVVAVPLVAAPLAAEAQRANPVRRIGVLVGADRTAPEVDGVQEGLRDHGYVEGRNLAIEWRFAEGREDRLRGFADELVTRKVEVIVTSSTAAAIAAKHATTTIPIVFTIVVDPVAARLVANLAHPGGNTTGFTNLSVELTGKRLELLKEAVPALTSVSILADPSNPGNTLLFKESNDAAGRLGLGVHLVEVGHRGELEKAFTQIPPGRDRAVVLLPGAFVFANRVRIVELASKARVPVGGWQSELAKSGALMSYGPSHFDIGRRAAEYVDKILKGAKPADLPVQEPTKFELIINLKTAKALGLTIPPSLLLRADHVIE